MRGAADVVSAALCHWRPVDTLCPAVHAGARRRPAVGAYVPSHCHDAAGPVRSQLSVLFVCFFGLCGCSPKLDHLLYLYLALPRSVPFAYASVPLEPLASRPTTTWLELLDVEGVVCGSVHLSLRVESRLPRLTTTIPAAASVPEPLGVTRDDAVADADTCAVTLAGRSPSPLPASSTDGKGSRRVLRTNNKSTRGADAKAVAQSPPGAPDATPSVAIVSRPDARCASPSGPLDAPPPTPATVRLASSSPGMGE